MFNKTDHDLSLSDRQVRYALAVRIALVLLSFFSAAWCLLQWTLTSEPRFMAEGIARQFVLLEAWVCLGLAAVAFVFLLANAFGWLSATLRIRHEQGGKPGFKHDARRIGAYI